MNRYIKVIPLIMLSLTHSSCTKSKLGMDNDSSLSSNIKLDMIFEDSDEEIKQPCPIPTSPDSKQFVSFDFAIKSLLRDKGDCEILESFISAILEAHNYPKVTIDQLLTEESNKESKHKKHSLIDIVVQDSNNNKYLIGIERNRKNCFIHKAVFSTSHRIVDHLESNLSYTNIEKIFHIDLLYFPVGNKPIYHGKTIFKALGESESAQLKLKITKKDIVGQLRTVVTKADDILPEYFLISIPNFSNKEDLKNYLEEWLYILKYERLPDNPQLPCSQKIQNKLMYMNMDDNKKEQYQAYLKKLRNQQYAITEAKTRTREKERKKNKQDNYEKDLRTITIFLKLHVEEQEIIEDLLEKSYTKEETKKMILEAKERMNNKRAAQDKSFSKRLNRGSA